MTTKLIYPFQETTPFIGISDRLWHMPLSAANFSDFSFPGWDNPLLFNNNNPVSIEYCSGNGAWIAEKALHFPTVNWIAIERKFERASKIWSKIKRFKLENLIVLWGEGFSATKNYFPSNSIQNIYINFPDPWPKKRHTKHRIIQPSFIEEMHRILKEESQLHFVTDDAPFGDYTWDIMKQFPQFSAQFPELGYTCHNDTYGSSYFETLWREKGRIIRYYQFTLKKEG